MEIQQAYRKNAVQPADWAPQIKHEATLKNHVLLASVYNERLLCWGKGLEGSVEAVYLKNLADLRVELKRVQPDVLLLDYDLPGLEGVQGVVGLRKLSKDTKIVMLSEPISDDEEWNFFRAGVRGCCRNEINSQSLKTLVKAIQQGELWIKRTLTHRLLDQLSNSINNKDNKESDRSCLGLLSSLTRREYEISLQVRNGGSNKQIAQSLEITERTVKAHLTGIYRKLGVVDRLKLAIVLSGDKRQARRDTSSRKVLNAG